MSELVILSDESGRDWVGGLEDLPTLADAIQAIPYDIEGEIFTRPIRIETVWLAPVDHGPACRFGGGSATGPCGCWAKKPDNPLGEERIFWEFNMDIPQTVIATRATASSPATSDAEERNATDKKICPTCELLGASGCSCETGLIENPDPSPVGEDDVVAGPYEINYGLFGPLKVYTCVEHGRQLYSDICDSCGDKLAATIFCPESNVVANATPSPEEDEVAAMLREFHDVFDVGAVERLHSSATLLNEEHGELQEALKFRTAPLAEGSEDTARKHVARELADVVYVAYGTALADGIDLTAAIREVHRANMSKLDTDGKPIKREDGKVLKGPNFSPPDMSVALSDQKGEGDA